MHPDRFLMAGVMGWPVMHSRSPLMHNYWMEQEGLAGTYVFLAINARRFGNFIGAEGDHALGIGWSDTARGKSITHALRHRYEYGPHAGRSRQAIRRNT